MSSLAKQLKSLQIPDQLSVLGIKSKKASILFDLKEAADLDIDFIYNLGLEGFQELETIDSGFSRFETALFNEDMKNMDRSQQTATFNEKLNAKLKEFLIHLSPYFLLKPAQKTLEWLIRGFQIHIFNVDELMCCILPFHETKLFARVIQVLTLNGTSNKQWQWLNSIQKGGSPLSKQTLIQHSISDTSFLTLLCKMIPDSLSVHGEDGKNLRVLFSFYASCLVGIIEFIPELTEIIVAKMIKFIHKGLKSVYHEYKAATYIILSQLLLSATLDEEMIKLLIERLAKSLDGLTAHSGLLCMVCILANQKLKVFPKKALKYLFQKKENLQLLEDVSTEHNISSLLLLLIPELICGALEQNVEENADEVTETMPDPDLEVITVDILQKVNLEAFVAVEGVRKLMHHYFKIREESPSSIAELVKCCGNLINIFEKRYPKQVDLVLRETFNNINDDDDEEDEKIKLQWLQDVLHVSMVSGKHMIIDDVQTPLVLGLNHPQSGIRKLAVKQLIEKACSEETFFEESFVDGSLLERLNDEDWEVVQEVLSAGQSLGKLIAGDALVKAVLEVIKRCTDTQRFHIAKHVFQIFGKDCCVTCDSNDLNRLVFELLPSLIPSHDKNVNELKSISEAICQSFLCKIHPFLAGIVSAFNEIDWRTMMTVSEQEDSRINLSITMMSRIADEVAKAENTSILVKAAFDYASVLQQEHPFWWILLCIMSNFTTTLPLKKFCDILDNIYPFIQSLGNSCTQLKGKHKYCKILLQDVESVAILKELLEILLTEEEAKKRSFAAHCFLPLFLKTLIQNVPKMADQMDRDLDEISISNKMHAQIFEILAIGGGKEIKKRPFVEIFRNLLQEYLKIHFENKRALILFLASIYGNQESFGWLTNASIGSINIEGQVCSLHISKVCLAAAFDEEKDVKDIVLSTDSQVLSTLLVLLHHPLKIIREASLGCLNALHNLLQSSRTSPQRKLISYIVESGNEIALDRQHVCSVLKQLVSEAAHSSPRKSSKVKDTRSALQYLADALSHAPSFIQVGLLAILKNFNSQELLLLLLPLLEKVILKARSRDISEEEALIFSFILKRFDVTTTDIFTREPLSFKLFIDALNISYVFTSIGLSPQQIALNQISPEFYSSISSEETKGTLFDSLLQILISISNVDVVRQVRSVLKELRISTNDVVKQFQSITDEQHNMGPKRPKRLKRSKAPAGAEEDDDLTSTTLWRKVLSLLEILQQKSNIDEPEILVPCYFKMLLWCLDLDTLSQSSVEYMKQLILSCLFEALQQIVSSERKGALRQEQFNVEHVIQCFRTSSNPQTHQQALLLLGKAAELFPDLVLHNIMTIFTFMGANILRQDDSYSFEIIKKTVDTVIPTLLKAGSTVQTSSSKGKSSESSPSEHDSVVKLIVRVFVDAIPYVPEHRRLPLLEHLVAVLGPEQYFHTVIAILIEKQIKQIRKEDNISEGIKEETISSDFCLSLSSQFSTSVELATVHKLIHYIVELPEEKPEERTHGREKSKAKSAVSAGIPPLFDVNKHSTKEIKQFKYNIISFASSVLTNPDFIIKTSKLSSEQLQEMEKDYLRLLEEVMTFVYKSGKSIEAHSQDATVKFWKAMLHKGCELVDKIYRLLQFDTFINVVTQLLHNENSTIRRKALEWLGDKIGQIEEFDHEQETKLIDLADALMKIARTDSNEIETPINKQTALCTLKLLIHALALKHPTRFVKMVPVITQLFASEEANGQVRARALLCFAELMSCLTVQVISCLPIFMPSLLKVANPQEKSQRNNLLTLSSVTALQQVVQAIPQFLSPYVSNMLEIITSSSLQPTLDTSGSGRGEANVKEQIHTRLKSLCQEIAESISPRVLLPAIDECYEKSVLVNQESLQPLMEITEHALTAISREDIKSFHQKLMAMFIKFLDFRSVNNHLEFEIIDRLEGAIIGAFCCLVLKLSENIFRPMFLKIFRWATGSESKKDRLITFYRLSGAMADKLKNLFLLFAGQILKNAKELLHLNHDEKRTARFFENESQDKKSCLLVNYILDVLQKCFQYDTQCFVNKDRFESLLQPLVDQIDNEIGGTEAYHNRASNYVVPCLTNFAAAINDESCWKSLNYQILLKTRSSSAQVRLSAMKVIQEIHCRLGESYMTLLPETIPFLAELMEDESFEVEKECQKTISQLEGILGESLQKYF